MNKTLILVVEDDAPIRNLITTTLKTHDYKYIVAANGENAIMEASSHNPDIVLLDLGLPDIDGVEVIRRIRSWSNMPIIVISARSEDSDKIEALDQDYVLLSDVWLSWMLPQHLMKLFLPMVILKLILQQDVPILIMKNYILHRLNISFSVSWLKISVKC